MYPLQRAITNNVSSITDYLLLQPERMFGKYQKEDHTFRNELLSDFEKRLYYAAENTALPEEPDMSKVQELVMTINERVVRDEI